MKRSLIRSGPRRIYHWPAMPPEAPHPSFIAIDSTTQEHSIHPTLAAATEWLDQCPINRALPFHQEEQ